MKKEIKNIPIIVANTEWPLPENLLKDIQAERMINGLLDMAKPNVLDDKDLVGWAECVGYLMPVTLKSILRSDVSEIYLYCVRRYLECKKIEVPPEIKEIELSDYQQKQLKEYKQWIFKSRGGREKNLILNTLKEVFVNPPPRG